MRRLTVWLWAVAPIVLVAGVGFTPLGRYAVFRLIDDGEVAVGKHRIRMKGNWYPIRTGAKGHSVSLEAFDSPFQPIVTRTMVISTAPPNLKEAGSRLFIPRRYSWGQVFIAGGELANKALGLDVGKSLIAVTASADLMFITDSPLYLEEIESIN